MVYIGMFGCFLAGYVIFWLWNYKKSIYPSPQREPIINVDLDGVFKVLEDLPTKVLRSIVSSTSFYR
jgi:hypothetical protein